MATLVLVGQIGPLKEISTVPLRLGRRRIAGSPIRAVARAKLPNLASNLAGLTVLMVGGHVVRVTGLLMAAASIAGGQVGAHGRCGSRQAWAVRCSSSCR
ncbi:hypothetical protein C8J25_12116 [Sphingomonas faeni]|uniref:Uncharacterized protein n=1 Tax=Sphingomonas faeni TaxID=185950 RepID=A0A2T5TW52_9SPHN|nr:hypothetical protein [Sphingomonas faeni]PTW43459.1 hypothetical protein C8J25_12116 [Sphingomonas faeni]